MTLCKIKDLSVNWFLINSLHALSFLSPMQTTIPLMKNSGFSTVEIAELRRRRSLLTIFPVALQPANNGNWKDNRERRARGSLSLLNNFCVLKFNRARSCCVLCRPRRGPRRHNFRLGAGNIRPNVEFSFPQAITSLSSL